MREVKNWNLEEKISKKESNAAKKLCEELEIGIWKRKIVKKNLKQEIDKFSCGMY